MREVVIGVPLFILFFCGAAASLVVSIGVLRQGIDTVSLSRIVFGGIALALWTLMFYSVVNARRKAAASENGSDS